MAGKKAIRKKVVPVPKDLAEITAYVREIGEAQREIEKIENDLNANIEKLKEKAVESIKSYDEIILGHAEGVYMFAQANRAGLTEDLKKKTVDVVSGILKWYLTPPAVKVEDEEKAIKELKKKKLRKFVRVKEEINKEAILESPKEVTGLKHISVSQEEIFSIQPADVKLEMIKGKRKFKKVIG